MRVGIGDPININESYTNQICPFRLWPVPKVFIIGLFSSCWREGCLIMKRDIMCNNRRRILSPLLLFSKYCHSPSPGSRGIPEFWASPLDWLFWVVEDVGVVPTCWRIRSISLYWWVSFCSCSLSLSSRICIFCSWLIVLVCFPVEVISLLLSVSSSLWVDAVVSEPTDLARFWGVYLKP